MDLSGRWENPDTTKCLVALSFPDQACTGIAIRMYKKRVSLVDGDGWEGDIAIGRDQVAKPPEEIMTLWIWVRTIDTASGQGF